MKKVLFAGLIFDYSRTCSCIPEHGIEISNIATEARVERSNLYNDEDSPSIEIIIVTALCFIVIVFFAIIISLFKTVRNLRTTVNTLKEDHGIITSISFKSQLF